MLRSTCLLSLAFVFVLGMSAPAAEKKAGKFVHLKSLKKDFFVAFGDAKSWKVNKETGVIECSGKPNGYICTKKSYSNYELTLEVKFPKQKGNTGILNYIAGKHKIWPACVEVQGLYDRMAMIFAMGGAKGPKTPGDAKTRLKALKPHQKWNKIEVTSKNGVLSAKINGKFIGKAGPYKVHKGPIGFQSEGAPVHFRNIKIKVLK